MPGFTIHMAIAKQYIAKHKSEIENEVEFIKGVIAPDMNKKLDGPAEDKSKNHYGKWGKYEVETYIDEFLNDIEINITQDFWKGYFLHLLTDHYFYNKDKYFRQEHQEMVKNNDRFYYDYDCLNKNLIEKYEIEIFDNIRKYMNIHEGEPKYLKIDKIINFIEEISSINIQDIIKIIEEKGMEGLE